MERLFHTGGSMRRSDGSRARSPQNQPPGQPPPPPPPVTSTQRATTPTVTASITRTLTASTTAVVVTTPPVSSRTTLVTSTVPVQSIPPKVSTFVSTLVSTGSSSAQTSATGAADTAGISSSSPSTQAVAVGTVSAVGAVAVILTVVFFCLTRYRARKKQVPTFDVYQRFSQYYRQKSHKVSSHDAPVFHSDEPPVPPLPMNIRSQSHYEDREEAVEKPEPNEFDKMRMRIAAVQELEEMEARLREDERAKAMAEESEKTSWNRVGEWVKNQTKRNMETKGLEKGRDKGSGDTRNSTAKGTWYL